jgi:hypothetical protein|tara:strand:+ start:1603 stop:2118 length:516 start_codon:yes stop_codon:yes gene_type:complete
MKTKHIYYIIGLLFVASATTSQLADTIVIFAGLKIVATAFFIATLFQTSETFGVIGGFIRGIIAAARAFWFYFCFGLGASISGTILLGKTKGDPLATAFQNLVTDSITSVTYLLEPFKMEDGNYFTNYSKVFGSEWNKPLLAILIVVTLVGSIYMGYQNRHQTINAKQMAR